jgi:hypothetical protein
VRDDADQIRNNALFVITHFFYCTHWVVTRGAHLYSLRGRDLRVIQSGGGTPVIVV